MSGPHGCDVGVRLEMLWRGRSMKRAPSVPNEDT